MRRRLLDRVQRRVRWAVQRRLLRRVQEQVPREVSQKASVLQVESARTDTFRRNRLPTCEARLLRWLLRMRGRDALNSAVAALEFDARPRPSPQSVLG